MATLSSWDDVGEINLTSYTLALFTWLQPATGPNPSPMSQPSALPGRARGFRGNGSWAGGTGAGLESALRPPWLSSYQRALQWVAVGVGALGPLSVLLNLGALLVFLTMRTWKSPGKVSLYCYASATPTSSLVDVAPLHFYSIELNYCTSTDSQVLDVQDTLFLLWRCSMFRSKLSLSARQFYLTFLRCWILIIILNRFIPGFL